ncbi:MAG: DUF4468 domain-containing protein [Chitinophagales bacterium]
MKLLFFPINEDTKLVAYEEVVQVPGLSADSLYSLTLEWMKTFYKSPSQAIKSQSREEGTIEIKNSFYLTRDVKGTASKAALINYYLTLQFRDGRFKYSITKINVDGNSYFGIERWINEEQFKKDKTTIDYLQQIDTHMRSSTESMENGIQPNVEKKEDAW